MTALFFGARGDGVEREPLEEDCLLRDFFLRLLLAMVKQKTSEAGYRTGNYVLKLVGYPVNGCFSRHN